MKTMIYTLFLATLLCGCVTTPPPKWNPVNEALEAEYVPYLTNGTATLNGQAFLVQRNGGVVKSAGREVTLDPATSVGDEWWEKAGAFWAQRSFVPPSPNFQKARRTAVADAEGRFKFSKLAGGNYYVRTSVTWEVPSQYEYIPNIQGGLVGFRTEIKVDEINEIVISQYAQPYLPQPEPAPIKSPKGQ